MPGLKAALTRIPWDTVFIQNDVDASIACWYDVFMTCIAEFVPKIIVKDGNKPSWIDREVLLLIRKKNRIRRKAKLNDFPVMWERFRKLRHEVKRLLKFKKRNYLSSLGSSWKDNPRRFWSYHEAISKSGRIPDVVFVIIIIKTFI